MGNDGLIFDIDGTLWDCTAACAEGFNRAYEELDCMKRVTAEDVRRISGRPSSECEAILLHGVPESVRSELAQTMPRHELAAVRAYAAKSFFRGVPEGVRQLSRSHRVFLVSNCSEEYLQLFLEVFPASESITDSECFGRTRKPKGENILAIAERNGLTAPCYIGDTASDEAAARFAGVPFFQAAYGFGRCESPIQAFEDFASLVRYFLD